MAFLAGVEEAASSPEEQLAALQAKLLTAKGPAEGAALPDGSELGAATLGRTYVHTALQDIFSHQRAKARCLCQLVDEIELDFSVHLFIFGTLLPLIARILQGPLQRQQRLEHLCIAGIW
jgi:hypothetical protein